MQRNVILILLFSILVAVFSIQNAHSVSVTFFTSSFEVSLIVVILGAIALGAVIMGLVSSIKQLKLKRQIRTVKREKDELEQQNRELEEKIALLEREKEEVAEEKIEESLEQKRTIKQDEEKNDEGA